MTRSTPRPATADDVVLLDPRGRPLATMPKAAVHHGKTPLHLAFSCHVVRDDGKVLITRRALTKRTWPGVVTNACCGHPRLGETLRDAVQRHLRSELRTRATSMAVAIADFVYRAEMNDGTIEHEVCPVVIAQIAGEPDLDLTEADAYEWISWAKLRDRALRDPRSLSPWSVDQIVRLPPSATSLLAMLSDPPQSLLDDPIVIADPHRPKTTPLVDGPAPLTASVQSLLPRFLDERRDHVVRHDVRALELHCAVSDLALTGGKQLRPRFVNLGWQAAHPARDSAPSFVAGAAIELLHTFALLHDDVMDGSTTRRGRRAAHVEFTLRHKAMRKFGDAERAGAAAALLAGNLAFVYADEMFDLLAQYRDVDLAAARAVFTELRTEVIVGQFLDVSPDYDIVPATSPAAASAEDAAIKVALLKSARYTVTRPLLLGLALAGCGEPALAQALQEFGDSIGIAFQLRDDVLDAFGNSDDTGKPTMGDIVEGKHTLLVARAARLAPAKDAAFLCDVINQGPATADDLERCRSIIATSGALASVEATIAARHRDALSALSVIQDADTCAGLAAIAAELVHREH